MKVVLVGNGGVGKTSIAIRYIRNSFSLSYKPSLGVDFYLKKLQFPEGNVKIIVYDTAGQEFVAPLRQKYYLGASGAIVVFSVTDRESFEAIEFWVNEVKAMVGDIQIVIVGNKTDLAEERVVSYDEAKQLADTYQYEYIEASALLGENIDTVFETFAKKALKQYINKK